jgi:1-acyl-sn-glycerol-3-phosphate acyltransferase
MLLCILLAAYFDGQLRKLFFGLRPGPDGAVWVHHWSRRIVRALGIACAIDGPAPIVAGRSLAVVSNHLSYLDILIYSAIRPFIMVAKSEVRSWPLIGWITAQAGTVYVERADVAGGRTQTRDQVNAWMAEAFRSGLPVLFFPEGTTSDGAGVLPFRRGLFHSVIHARIPLQAAAVAYSLDRLDQQTSIAHHICFWGEMNFAPHLFRCLGVRGLQAHVQFGEEEWMSDDRFRLAREAHEQVAGLYADLAAAAARSKAAMAATRCSTSGEIDDGRPLTADDNAAWMRRLS